MIEEPQELAARKRAELEGALERREVHDPFSATFLVSLAVSAAISAASYVISAAFAPKPPKQTIGKLQGNLQLQNSEQGIMIPEIYGAGPTAAVAAGASPTWQNLTNTTGGANGSITKTSGANQVYNAGASSNVAVASGDDAFIRIIVGSPIASAGFFNTASPTGSGSSPTGLIFGIQWSINNELRIEVNAVGTVVGTFNTGDTFTIELRSGHFHLYKGSAEIFGGVAVPAPSYPMYMGICMFTTGAGVSNTKVKINALGDAPNFARGGVKVPAIIDWSSGIRKNVSTTQVQQGGKGFMGGRSQTVENISYDIDLGLSFCKGPVSLLRLYANADVLIDDMDTSTLLTGIYNPGTGADTDYDPELPPDPNPNYMPAFDRQDLALAYDGDSVGTGTVGGGQVGFAVYSGTETQDPDPTEEADIDAKYGTGSTTAHRGKARVVLNNFDLSRWGGIVPNMTAAWENPALATLDDIYASLCERVNVKAATSDYDFSGISTIQPRGMLIAGRLFSPAEVMGSPDIQTVYNYFVTEAEGQIISYIEGAEPSVTIADTEIGWMDSDGDVTDILPEVDTVIASEIGLAREVHVKYIDLDKEWEPNTQSDNRQITEGVSTEIVEVQLALLGSEARTAAQRKLYRDYVAGSVHKFTLDWKYLYLYPGYKITITRAEGFNHVLKLTSISGGLGVLECEGVAIEPAAFTQPSVVSISPGFPPQQPIPAMTILTLLDTPLLRDGDETNNNGIGFYACGTPRTGFGQSWVGFALYRNRNSVYGIVGESNLPGTIGTIVSAVGLSADPNVIDNVGVFTVDLYGTTASLASVTEMDLKMDTSKNSALVGDMVTRFTTATQVAGFPNRWTLSGLLNGRRGTESHLLDTFTGARFVLIDAAVKFVPIDITDLNNEMQYRAVTSGQSLADAATVDFVWTGGAVRPLAPVAVRADRDVANNLLVIWTRRTRLQQGLRDLAEVPIGEEREEYRVEVYSGTTLLRTMPAITGMSLPAIMDIPGGTKGSTLSTSSTTTQVGRSFQLIGRAGNFIEATLTISSVNPDPNAGIGIVSPTADWTNISGGPPLSTPEYEVTLVDSGTFDLQVRRFGTLVFTLGGVTVSERVRITLTGSEARFHRNWTGPGSPPFYVGVVAPTYPYHAFAHAQGSGTGASGKVQNIVMTIHAQPAIVYSAAQQTQDGLTPGDPVKLRIYQLSATVGKGDKTEVTV